MQADLVTPRALVNTGSRMDDLIVDWNKSHRFLIPSCPYEQAAGWRNDPLSAGTLARF